MENITDDEEILAKDSFDFSTKIKKNVLLRAVYETEAEYEGNLGAQCTDGNYRNTLITAITEANQKLTITYYREVN